MSPKPGWSKSRFADVDLPHLPNRLSSEEILERTGIPWHLYWLVWWCFPISLIVLFGLCLPIHTWLHSHLEFLVGILVGSLLQVPIWARDRWLWLKWFSHQ